jgi:hypothetical protein
MRKAMPTMTESATELHCRMKSEQDLKKRQRLQAFYLAASGHARHRRTIATLLGVHRYRGCFENHPALLAKRRSISRIIASSAVFRSSAPYAHNLCSSGAAAPTTPACVRQSSTTA